MNMFKRSLTVFAFLITSGIALALPKTIMLASEEWPERTNKDGSGLYWDLIKEVYSRAGVEVKHTIVPYSRSVAMTESGEVDGWVASYEDEEDWAVFPENGFDQDNVVALVLAKNAAGWSGQDSVKGKHLSWMRGYAYDDYLDVDVDYTEVDKRTSGVALVRRERAFAFLDDKREIMDAVEGSGTNTEGMEVVPMLGLSLYLGFMDNSKGEELAKAFDVGWEAMMADGTVAKIFAKYGAEMPF